MYNRTQIVSKNKKDSHVNLISHRRDQEIPWSGKVNLRQGQGVFGVPPHRTEEPNR